VLLLPAALAARRFPQPACYTEKPLAMPVSRSFPPPEPDEIATDQADGDFASGGRSTHASRSALFAKPRHSLGWQGFTLTLPADWDLAQFGGTQENGTMRVDDGDGPRLEMRWETPQGAMNAERLERSVSHFLSLLERNAKKKKQPFQAADHPHIAARSRKHKAQLVNFGWTGDMDDPLVAHGWGTVWHCTECNRVVVAHLIGRGREKPGAAQRLAADVLNAMECHGHGGWQAWSVFGLSVEIPTEFALSRAKLQTGRLEIEWQRPLPPGLRGWQSRPERIALCRVAAANVLLEYESLESWTRRTAILPNKHTAFDEPQETTVDGEGALLFDGMPRLLRQRMAQGVRARLLRQSVPRAELRVWHSTRANKILVLETELTPQNHHVVEDVLDSLEYQ